MPGGNIFHIGHALALDGMGDDHGRACRAWRRRGGSAARIAAMSWPSISATAQPKARHLAASGSSRMIASLRVVALQLVVVDHGAEIVELVMRARTSRLPTLRLPAIRRRPAACRPAPASSAASGPSPCRCATENALAQRAGAGFDPGQIAAHADGPGTGCSACADCSAALRIAEAVMGARRHRAPARHGPWTAQSGRGRDRRPMAGQTFSSAP